MKSKQGAGDATGPDSESRAMVVEDESTPREAVSKLDETERLQALRALARLDHEAAAAYEICAGLAEDEEIALTLRAFASDHLRHVDKIAALLVDFGAPAPSRPMGDALLLAPLSRTAASLSLDAAVMALIANEQLTNRTYETLLELEWDERTLAVLQQNADDEQRHLAWLAEAEGALWDELGEGLEAGLNPQ